MNDMPIDDGYRKSIKKIYEKALMFATSKDEPDVLVVVFDKTEEGLAARNKAAAAFNATHQWKFDESDLGDIKARDHKKSHEEMIGDEAHEDFTAPKYPAIYLPTRREVDGDFVAYPELTVLLEMTHGSKKKDAGPTNSKPEPPAEEPGLRRYRDRNKDASPKNEENPEPSESKPEIKKPIYLLHIEANAEGYGRRIEQALFAHESALKFEEETPLGFNTQNEEAVTDQNLEEFGGIRNENTVVFRNDIERTRHLAKKVAEKSIAREN